MAKLSETFLKLLGDTLQGAGGLTPEVKAELALRQSQNSRANVSTLADLSQNYNQLPPNFIGPKNAGTIQPSATDLTSLGVSPGTSFQPISRTATTPFVTPGKTPGSSNLNYSSKPLARGESVEPTINTLSPYAALLGHQMNFQKDLFDKYDQDMRTAQQGITALTMKLPGGMGATLYHDVTAGLGIPSDIAQSPEYQAISGQIKDLSAQYLQAKTKREGILSGIGGQGGGAPPPSSSAPPTAFKPLMPGNIRVKLLQGGQTGQIPQTLFNPLLHQPIDEQGNPVQAQGAGQAPPQLGAPPQ